MTNDYFCPIFFSNDHVVKGIIWIQYGWSRQKHIDIMTSLHRKPEWLNMREYTKLVQRCWIIQNICSIYCVSATNIICEEAFNLISFKKKNFVYVLKEEFEDTKEVIRIHISKNRQHNGQKKKYNRTNKDLQNIHIHAVPKSFTKML